MNAASPAAPVTEAYLLERASSMEINHVVVVGAGGIGARLIPLLLKFLNEGSCISVIDHDTVEQRNLWRQHFCEADLGRYKAEVMASRYHGDRGVEVHAFTEPVSANVLASIDAAQIYVGCLDNRTARAALHTRVMVGCGGCPSMLVDAGNETNTGQVLLGWNAGTFNLLDVLRDTQHHCSLDPATAMPEVFDAAGDAADEGTFNCAGPDLQTSAINNMAAAVAANAIYIAIKRIRFFAGGWVFTSSNTIEPIRLRRGERIGGSHRLMGEWQRG